MSESKMTPAEQMAMAQRTMASLGKSQIQRRLEAELADLRTKLEQAERELWRARDWLLATDTRRQEAEERLLRIWSGERREVETITTRTWTN